MRKRQRQKASRTTRTVLVPTDFSKEAWKAATYAADLCAVMEAPLVLLHVTEPFHIGSFAEGAVSHKFHKQLTEAANRKLQEWLRRLRPRIDVEACLKQGSPWKEIVTFAKRSRPEIVIMGSHGYTGLKHLALGSTAERVVRYAPCSVLVVRG